MRSLSTINSALPYVRRRPSKFPTRFDFNVPLFVHSTWPKTFSPWTLVTLRMYSPLNVWLPVPQIPDHFPAHSPTRCCGSTGVCGVCATTGAIVTVAIAKAISTKRSVATIGFSFADPGWWFTRRTVPRSMGLGNARVLHHDRIPAVDDDGLAGDEVVVGDEAHDGLRHVVGRRDAAERRALGAALHQAIVVGAKRGLHPPSFHPARRDGVDAHLGREDARERYGHVDDGRLARRVRDHLGGGAEAGDARQVHDRARTRSLEQRRGGAGGEERPAHVDVEDPIPDLRGDRLEVVEGSEVRRASGVDEHVEPAQLALAGGHHRAHGFVVDHVTAMEERTSAERLHIADGRPRLRL